MYKKVLIAVSVVCVLVFVMNIAVGNFQNILSCIELLMFALVIVAFIFLIRKPEEGRQPLVTFSSNIEARCRHHEILIEIGEFLLDNGFDFLNADIDGLSEIGHTGYAAYSKNYTDFAEFRDKFEEDYERTKKDWLEDSWIASVGYDHIYVFFRRGNLQVRVAYEGTFAVKWNDFSEADFRIMDALTKFMNAIPGVSHNRNS